MGNVGGSSHSSIWKAKTRLLMLKMVYSAQSTSPSSPCLLGNHSYCTFRSKNRFVRDSFLQNY